MIVILTGPIGVGKSVVADALIKKGFLYMRFSDVVKSELEKQNLEPTRENMQQIGAKLRQSGGLGILGKKLREKAEANPNQDWCFDGSRNPEEIQEIRQIKNIATHAIGVTAPMETLIQRILDRHRDIDVQMSAEEAKEKILIELGELPSPANFNIQGCLDICDLIIENTGTIEEAQTKILNYLNLE